MKNNDWEVQILRFTGFLQPSAKPIYKNWWKRITGDDPENRNEKPKENIIEDSGKFKIDSKYGNLKLILKPERIDLICEPIFDINDPSIPTIGNYITTTQFFSDNIVSRLISDNEEFPDLTRLAFGAVLFKNQDNIEDVFNLLSSYLNCIDFNLISKNTDFQYNTNRPRIIEMDNLKLKINRLMKWNARIMNLLSINTSSNERILTAYPQVMMELDINTAVEEKQHIFNNNIIINILSILIKFANEICTEGDIE